MHFTHSNVLLAAYATTAWALPSGAANLVSRQAPTVPVDPPMSQPYKIEEIKPTLDWPGVKRIRIWYGPFKVKGQNETTSYGNFKSMDGSGTAWMNLAGGIPRDITILHTNTAFAYADGSRADVTNGIYSHHAYVSSPDNMAPKWYDCGGNDLDKFDYLTNPAGPLLIGGSEDKYGGYYTTPKGDVRSGFYLNKSNRLMLNGDVINYTNQTKTVFSLNEIEYVPGQLKDAGIANMYVTVPGQCSGGSAIVIPKDQTQKKFSLHGKELNITANGKILAFRGHLHDGGVSVTAKLNNVVVCVSNATYGSAAATAKPPMMMSSGGSHGHSKRHDPTADMPMGTKASNDKWETISEMSQCSGPIVLRKGDKLAIEADYDMVTHPVRVSPSGDLGELMALGVIFFSLDSK